MKQKKIRPSRAIPCLCCAFCIALACLSCATATGGYARETEGLLFGMLYDHENNPVQGVSVTVDGEAACESDVLGRFVVNVERPGLHAIRLTKDGHEPVESTFSFEPTAMLYFRMITASQLVVEAERALDSFDAVAALGYLDRAERLEPFRYDARFLRAVALYSRKDVEGAKRALAGAIEAGYAGPCGDAFARMLEAGE